MFYSFFWKIRFFIPKGVLGPFLGEKAPKRRPECLPNGDKLPLGRLQKRHRKCGTNFMRKNSPNGDPKPPENGEKIIKNRSLIDPCAQEAPCAIFDLKT